MSDLSEHLAKLGYLYETEIARGGWGTIIGASPINGKGNYAIKIVSKKFLVEINGCEQFKQEVEIHRSIRHFRIVDFVEFKEDQKYCYLVTKRCNGVNLHTHVISTQQIPPKQVEIIFTKVLEGIYYLHSGGIAHGDIKLENIMYNTVNSEVRILDFGFAHKATLGSKISSMFCSIGYSAPEVLKHIPFDPFAADMYSLGVVFYALFTRRLPFQGNSIVEIHQKMEKMDIDFPQYISITNQKIIRNLLAFNPEERPTCLEMLTYFHRIVGGAHMGLNSFKTPIGGLPQIKGLQKGGKNAYRSQIAGFHLCKNALPKVNPSFH